MEVIEDNDYGESAEEYYYEEEYLNQNVRDEEQIIQSLFQKGPHVIGEIESGQRVHNLDLDTEKLSYYYSHPEIDVHGGLYIGGVEVQDVKYVYFINPAMWIRGAKSRVFVGWNKGAEFDNIVNLDGYFFSTSQNEMNWVYAGIFNDQTTIVTNEKTIKISGKLRYPPQIDNEGNVFYVSCGVEKCKLYRNGKVIVEKDSLISIPSISPNGNIAYAFMNGDEPDKVHFILDGNNIYTLEGLDPDWAGYGMAVGLYNSVFYEGFLFYRSDSERYLQFDMQGNLISDQIRFPGGVESINTLDGKLEFAKNVRGLGFARNVKWSVIGDFQEYFLVDESTGPGYPIAFNGDEVAYVKEERIIESTIYGDQTILKNLVVHDSSISTQYNIVKYLRFINGKLVYIAEENLKEFVVIDGTELVKHDEIIGKLYFHDNKIGYVARNGNTLSWVIEDF